MATVSFSRSAKADLLSIGAYTLQTWGAAQAERYIGSLEACAKLLAGNPALGRPCGWIRPACIALKRGAMSFSIGGRKTAFSFRVFCIKSMLPEDHPFVDVPPDA